jgi:transposase
MTERRTFSAEFKAKVVLEMIRGEKGLMQASRDYQIKDTVLSRWKQEFLERAPELFKSENQHQDSGVDNERVQELERMVGKMTMELEVAKKVLNGTSLVSPGRKRS